MSFIDHCPNPKHDLTPPPNKGNRNEWSINMRSGRCPLAFTTRLSPSPLCKCARAAAAMTKTLIMTVFSRFSVQDVAMLATLQCVRD